MILAVLSMCQNIKKMYMTPLRQFVFLSYWEYKTNSKYRIKTTRKWNRLTTSKKIYRYFNHTLYRNKAFHWAIHHQILNTLTEYTYPSSRVSGILHPKYQGRSQELEMGGAKLLGEGSGGRLRPPVAPGQSPGRGARGAKPPGSSLW